MSEIQGVRALEVLDSRGNPTVRVYVDLDSGETGVATVPSGASTGENEAVELRDGDASRYSGKGVLTAVRNVEDRIAPEIIGLDPSSQADVDHVMIELDGTPNKSSLGANAMLGVSMAVACAASLSAGLPLYAYLGGASATRLPVPMMNILNGGKHADNSVTSRSSWSFRSELHRSPRRCAAGTETFHALAAILKKRGYSTAVGDEGGFAPDLKTDEEACEVIVEAIEAAGYKPGQGHLPRPGSGGFVVLRARQIRSLEVRSRARRPATRWSSCMPSGSNVSDRLDRGRPG